MFALDLHRLEVLPWNEILPELKGIIDSKRKNARIADVVVFLIVALGVLNTMAMSTFERTREFGVLRSVGTRPKRILAMVVLEALLTGLIGFAVGLGLAWLSLRGIGVLDYGKIGGGADMMGARMPETIAITLRARAVAAAAVVAAVTMIAGALVPAIRAARMKPVEATRYI